MFVPRDALQMCYDAVSIILHNGSTGGRAGPSAHSAVHVNAEKKFPGVFIKSVHISEHKRSKR